MRTLCLNLQRNESLSVVEQFLNLSPRIQFREPSWIFADISDSSHLFQGEMELLQKTVKQAQATCPHSTAAIADDPYTAQVFSVYSPSTVVPPLQQKSRLRELPIEALAQLEGLENWQSQQQIQDIVYFFQMIGFQTIDDIITLGIECFRERWGSLGTRIWKRLHGEEGQVISPFVPLEALKEYVHLDFPISLLSFLMHRMEKKLHRLQARLWGRGEFAQKIYIHLYCEYSDEYHLIELLPAQPTRDSELLLKLLEQKLAHVNLENPIREFEIEIIACPERTYQLDFWEPQAQDFEKIQRFMGLAQQAGIQSGFFRLKNDTDVENSWELTPQPETFEPVVTSVEHEEKSFRVRTAYSEDHPRAPRPTQLLEEPQLLSQEDLNKIRFLSRNPMERFDNKWWESSRGRDYFFGLSQKGQSLWIFFDQVEREYYLHGYFD